MDQVFTFNIPAKNIKTTTGTNYAHSCMQGRRPTMEDAYSHHTFLNFQCYALFDGHGGSAVSQELSNRFFKVFEMYARRQMSSSQLGSSLRNHVNESQKVSDLVNTIKETVIYMDKWIDANLENVAATGSTCVASIIDTSNRKMFICNLGDSRAVLIEDGVFKFATDDHKPNFTPELKRIKEIGGNVQNNRVQGLLAVSRAFGDYYLKDDSFISRVESKLKSKFNPGKLQLVSNEPDIFIIDLASCDPTKIYHLCLACDGVFDVCSSARLASLLDDYFQKGEDLEVITENLVAWAYENNSMDNISLMLIEL